VWTAGGDPRANLRIEGDEEGRAILTGSGKNYTKVVGRDINMAQVTCLFAAN
jgi:hypothetical protein